jgi:hypothetical protein
VKPPLRKDQQSFRTRAVPRHWDAPLSSDKIFAFTWTVPGPSNFTQPEENQSGSFNNSVLLVLGRSGNQVTQLGRLQTVRFSS